MEMQERTGLSASGFCQDTIIYPDGTKEVLEGSNLVVNTFPVLLQLLLKRQSGYNGITYWAVGSGNDSWDSSTPSPALSDTRLTNEIGRVSIDAANISFLDPNLNVTTTPTNIILITRTFSTSECNGKWREFGLFGGNATSTLNSGIMVNHRMHGVITKTSEIAVERKLRFTINLT